MSEISDTIETADEHWCPRYTLLMAEYPDGNQYLIRERELHDWRCILVRDGVFLWYCTRCQTNYSEPPQ